MNANMSDLMSQAIHHEILIQSDVSRIQQQPQQQLSPHQQSPQILSPCLSHRSRFRQPLKPESPLNFAYSIPFSQLKLSTDTLGSGSYGTVFKGLWRDKIVAVKQFKSKVQIDSFEIEAKQLSYIKHKNIVTLYGASTTPDCAYLVMEFAEGGSLNYLLHECKEQRYDLRHACSWARQTAQAVAYLHGFRPKPIMHRDLKPANLLLFPQRKILKICDFGTACSVRTNMTNNMGSASYMAPEVFSSEDYSESGDVYSWSIIFWEILARLTPYQNLYESPYQILWKVKQDKIRPKELKDCPVLIWQLITRCWDDSYKSRPSMEEVAKEMDLIYALTDGQSANASSQTRGSGTQRAKPSHTSANHDSSQVIPKSPDKLQEFDGHFLKDTGFDDESNVYLNLEGVLCSKTEAKLSRTIELLKCESLRNSTNCDMVKSTWDCLKEFDGIKVETDRKRKELKQIRSCSNTSTSSRS